ncbi:MAG: VOC family protein [Synergistes sp.]|nr:VOC family protein [Synergistes sp.]
MKLKGVLIAVNDVERSRKFYHDMFGLEPVADNDGNMVLTEGLFLQDVKIWEGFLSRGVIPDNNSSELYFEEEDIEGFVRKLERLYPEIRYVNRLMAHSWGQKVVRFYDLDGNLIEVGTPM